MSKTSNAHALFVHACLNAGSVRACLLCISANPATYATCWCGQLLPGLSVIDHDHYWDGDCGFLIAPAQLSLSCPSCTTTTSARPPSSSSSCTST
jgi:hypothetical protein